MKKTIILLAIVATGMALTSCGGSDTGATAPVADSAAVSVDSTCADTAAVQAATPTVVDTTVQK